MFNRNILHSYIDIRLFEWAMSSGMLMLSLEMIMWPMTINGSAFRWLVVIVPPGFVGVLMFFAGLMRIIALVINGRSHIYGPIARAFGAMIGALMWAQFTLALIMPFAMNETKIPSPGIPFWFSFMWAEIYVCYRATFDVRK